MDRLEFLEFQQRLHGDNRVTQTSHTAVCLECRGPAPDGQATCGQKCRQRRSRRRRRQRTAWIVVMRELSDMRDGIKRRENLAEFREQLIHLAAEVKDLQHLAGDEDEVSRRQMLEDRARKSW